METVVPRYYAPAVLADGRVDHEATDRFSMYAALVDKHWRIVEKYLPKQARPERNLDGSGLLCPEEIVSRLVARVVGDQPD